jgi:hypothetical protein
MLDALHFEDFVPHLHSSFQLILPNGAAYTLELNEAKDLSAVPYQEQFSLHFRAPLTLPSAQGIYHLTHETLGEGDIFLVPIVRDANALTFEAIFNRPRKTEPNGA